MTDRSNDDAHHNRDEPTQQWGAPGPEPQAGARPDDRWPQQPHDQQGPYGQRPPQGEGYGAPGQQSPYGQQGPDYAPQSGQGSYAQSGNYAQPPAGPGGPGYPGGQYGSPPEGGPKQKNVPGIIALVCAIIGFIFACIPGALIVGWILLPIAFILSIVSLFQKHKGKGTGVAALIISVVGTIVGVIVFFTVVASAVDDSFGTDDFDVSTPAPSVSAPATEPEGQDNTEAAAPEPDAGDEENTEAAAPEPDAGDEENTEAEEGTRENPLPIGTTVTQGDWELTVNSVNLDATQEVLDENEFNEGPADGDVYVLVNLTMKYIGDASDGRMPMPSLAYVTVDGHTRETFDTMAVAPDPLLESGPLYEGAAATGNVLVAAPADTAGQGTIAVRPSMLGDKIFFAAK